jgi:hypothetical protein
MDSAEKSELNKILKLVKLLRFVFAAMFLALIYMAFNAHIESGGKDGIGFGMMAVMIGVPTYFLFLVGSEEYYV